MRIVIGLVALALASSVSAQTQTTCRYYQGATHCETVGQQALPQPYDINNALRTTPTGQDVGNAFTQSYLQEQQRIQAQQQQKAQQQMAAQLCADGHSEYC